ncbi:choice-of-anchor L domain-containing protein [Fluviicola sp.]|uniref:choice-of-anchor L domain-containing protein n=1 Tax=Fluviicola sp. TaxID=1917219 RepID=UPI0031DD6010
MKKITTILGVIMALCCFTATGQVTTQNTMTPQQLVQSVLVGQGVVVSNVKYNNSLVNAQTVQGNALSFTSSTFPFANGVYMRTNGGPGTVTYDQDLGAIATNTVTNGCIIEFDFIPSGDTISFRYMFASAEYPSYACSDYNDVFGFFISGPGFSGPYQNGADNIALVPGGSVPVAINTVNSGTAGIYGAPSYCNAQDPNWQSNAVYYTTTYGNTTGYPYNAGTVVMTANASVQCGQTYHIKLAISNVGDQILDSGVYLEGSSFSSEAVNIAVATVTGDTTVIENCTDAQFIFSRPQTQLGDTLVVNYGISGTATMGVDYNNLPNPVTFLPGQDTIIITLTPFGDGITESPETVIITATTITPCGDTIVTSGTLYIIDGPTLPINESNPTVYCANDSVMVTAAASGGFPPYTYTWSYGGQTGGTAYVPVLQNGSFDFYVTATDQCGNTGTDTVTVTMNQTLAIDTMMTFMASACTPDGAVSGIGQGITGQPHYHWEGPNTGGPISIDASVMQNLGPGWYVFTITDNVCSVTDSVYLDSEPGPIADMSLSAISGCNPLNVTFTNNSQNATNYEWYFGNGNTAFVNDLSSQSQTYTASADIALIVINGPCRDTAFASVLIVECGCTDPLATNYDPTAVQNDGSCLYPEPTVIVPNIFTPNGDNNNDVFKLTTTNATDVNIRINNRWGNVVYEGSGLDPFWDGKINGTLAADGVYFLQYTVKGLMGKEITGQGFIQLIRD